MGTRFQITEELAQAVEDSSATEERLVSKPIPGSTSEWAARRGNPDVYEPAGGIRGLEGRFRSGNADFAEAHDQYLDDAFDQRLPASMIPH